jgi:hypothetical protein
MMILKWILKEYYGRMLTGFVCLRMGAVTGSYEYDNEPSDSMKCCEFIEWLNNC